MGLAVWALILYILLIIVWVVVVKRNIGEAMILGLIFVAIFGGTDFLSLIWEGLKFGATHEVLYAAMAFVFMAHLVDKTGIILKLIGILNSLLGKIPGGAGFVDTIASALFGTISGSGSGNTAAVGAITIPWMKNSNWKGHQAATVVAGNAGLGISFPPSGSMFILLGMSSIGAIVSEGQLFVALFIGGLYTLIYRLIFVFFYVKYNKIGRIPSNEILPINESFKNGWTSLLIFLGIIIPVIITIGPVSEALMNIPTIGENGLEDVSILIWVPILVILISIFGSWKAIPKKPYDIYKFVESSIPSYAVLGVILLFAFAASNALDSLGLGEQLGVIMNNVNLPMVVVALIIGVLIVLVATPLTATATVTAIGAVAFESLVSAGVDPVVALVGIIIFASTEGASPPGAAPIFIASGIAKTDPVKTFAPLIVFYVIPVSIIGWLVLIGVLPVPIL
jgi:C4-dicarboxylate transporter DctM subunit